MTPRALLSLLFNGSKAIDVVQTALDLGLLDALDPGPVSLGDLSERLGLRPVRLYKLLDCLECIGLVRREQQTVELQDTEYVAVAGARQAAEDVLGPDSVERDRDRYPWTTLHGRLGEVLRGDAGMPDEAFSWPPSGDEQIASFEQSMAAGLPPIVESFRNHSGRLWGDGNGVRVLDVGGGDGTLATELLANAPELRIDVYNLPAVEPLVESLRRATNCGERLGFVGGDFLAEPLPAGYDVISFVRVLHDWESPITRSLLEKAYAALDAGGLVVICEEFRTAERLAQQFFWSYFLLGVDSCSSMLREVTQYGNMLRDVGFGAVEVLPGPFDIVIATKVA